MRSKYLISGADGRNRTGDLLITNRSRAPGDPVISGTYGDELRRMATDRGNESAQDQHTREGVEPLPALLKRKGWVYFIQARTGGPVKIGFSYSPSHRLADLQIGCPVRLQIIAKIPGTDEVERELHRELAKDRSHGEWFRPTDRLRAVFEKRLGGAPRSFRQSAHARIERAERDEQVLAELNCAACKKDGQAAGGLLYGICAPCAREIAECLEHVRALDAQAAGARS